jgi:hypothetical protein
VADGRHELTDEHSPPQIPTGHTRGPSRSRAERGLDKIDHALLAGSGRGREEGGRAEKILELGATGAKGQLGRRGCLQRQAALTARQCPVASVWQDRGRRARPRRRAG